MTQLLIVNADDYGLTDGVNRAIEDAHSGGILSSTTVLVTGGGAAAAEELPRRWPELGVGLHVNLTLGQPASDPGRVRTLVDSEGRLLPERRLFERVVRGRVDRREVADEVAAQARLLKEMGVQPTHWDPHETVAFWPWLSGPTSAAARAAGIRRVRCCRVWVISPGRAPWQARWRWRLSRPLRLATEANRMRGLVMLRRHFAMPSWRTGPGLVIAPDGDYEARWRTLFRSLPPALSEVVAHPGYPDDELAALAPSMCDTRLVDLRVLTEPAVRRDLDEAGVRLVSFRELAPRRRAR